MQDVRDNIFIAFKLIAEDISYIWKKCLAQYNLKDSNLAEQTETQTQFPNILFSYNDYAEYIESGRKPYVKKVPINALIDWARRKGIPTDNNVLYAIRESIYKNGIKPRNILTSFYDAIEKEFDDTYSSIIFESIIESLNEYFNN